MQLPQVRTIVQKKQNNAKTSGLKILGKMKLIAMYYM